MFICIAYTHVCLFSNICVTVLLQFDKSAKHTGGNDENGNAEKEENGTAEKAENGTAEKVIGEYIIYMYMYVLMIINSNMIMWRTVRICV